MTIYMYRIKSFDKIIVVTNRHLVEGDFLDQIRLIAGHSPKGIILREKDLSKDEYIEMAIAVKQICDEANVELLIHSDPDIAREIGCKSIHISLSKVDRICEYIKDFDTVSVSCHSLEDVKNAIEKGATQIVLGTIFETECKKGLKGKGLDFVEIICEYCKTHGKIPVYAIGGICPDNLESVIKSGAKGGCMMSYMMKYKD